MTETASSHLTHTIVSLIAGWWWLGLIVLSSAADSVRRMTATRHRRKLALVKAAALARALVAEPAPRARKVPGPCQHLRVSQVRDRDDVLVAWLCLNAGCGKQLPADWAVAAEDLP